MSEQVVKYFLVFSKQILLRSIYSPFPRLTTWFWIYPAQFWSLNLLPKARLVLRGGPGELVLILGVQKVLEGSGLPPILAGTAEQNSQN